MHESHRPIVRSYCTCVYNVSYGPDAVQCGLTHTGFCKYYIGPIGSHRPKYYIGPSFVCCLPPPLVPGRWHALVTKAWSGSLANFLTTDQRVQVSRRRKIGQNSESIVLQPHQRTVDMLASVDYCRGPVYVVIKSKYLCFGRKNKVNTFQYS